MRSDDLEVPKVSMTNAGRLMIFLDWVMKGSNTLFDPLARLSSLRFFGRNNA